ncbi:MAG: hypothetical protein JO247_04575 [Chloroflexi bacterium]|nr:hypothetical protein [Chloroflexota bacterium]
MTTSYERYIRPAELPAVEPLAAGETPDEQFFIRTHQAFEIWFAQILAELEFVRAQLSGVPVAEQDLPLMAHHLRRAAAIFDLLHAHLPVLEMLLTTEFFDFRQELFGAGGRESYRFREVEWLMGFREASLLEYLSGSHSSFHADHAGVQRYQEAEAARIATANPGSTASAEALRAREADLNERGSLRQHLMAWLGRTPYPAPDGTAVPSSAFAGHFAVRFGEHFRAAYQTDVRILTDAGALAGGENLVPKAMQRLEWFLKAPERCAILFILQFARQPRLAAPADLLEAVLELDEALLNWRDRHIEMVARVIGGGRISTMGAVDSGLGYLKATISKRAFPEVWEARSFLLGQGESEGMYGGEPGAWGQWRHYRLAFEVLDS